MWRRRREPCPRKARFGSLLASGDEHGLPVHRQTLLGRPVHPIMGQSDALTLPREVLAAVVPLGFESSADQKAVVLVERDVPSIEEDVEVGSEQDAIAYAVAAMIGDRQNVCSLQDGKGMFVRHRALTLVRLGDGNPEGPLTHALQCPSPDLFNWILRTYRLELFIPRLGSEPFLHLVPELRACRVFGVETLVVADAVPVRDPSIAWPEKGLDEHDVSNDWIRFRRFPLPSTDPCDGSPQFIAGR